jgi:hypothetical protein
MKNYAIRLVWFTTAYLVVFTVLSALSLAFPLLWGMLLVGQLLVLHMVYKVLTDDFKTDKKFRDWYGDMPKKKPDSV